MTYCKNYCEEKGISTSRLNEAQKTLYYIAENMKMDKSISKNGYFHFQMAIKALEQEPCDDAISRTDMLDAIGHGTTYTSEDLQKIIKTLPSVTPKREQGEWIQKEYWSEGCGMGETYGYYYECSKCGNLTQGEYDKCGLNYCPDCGAEMAERGEE